MLEYALIRNPSSISGQDLDSCGEGREWSVGREHWTPYVCQVTDFPCVSPSFLHSTKLTQFSFLAPVRLGGERGRPDSSTSSY
jgi:hypothetical protein